MLLETLGLNLADLMAGTLGGVCNVFLFRRQGFFAIIGAMVVGATTGGYTGAWVGDLVHVAHTICALVIGFSGGAFLKMLASQFIKHYPTMFGNIQDGERP